MSCLASMRTLAKKFQSAPWKINLKPKHWTNSTNSVEDQDFQPSADLYWRFGREALQRCFVLGWDSDDYTTCSEEKHLFVVSEPMFGFGVIVFLTIRAPWKSLKIHHCNFSWPLGLALFGSSEYSSRWVPKATAARSDSTDCCSTRASTQSALCGPEFPAVPGCFPTQWATMSDPQVLRGGKGRSLVTGVMF